MIKTSTRTSLCHLAKYVIIFIALLVACPKIYSQVIPDAGGPYTYVVGERFELDGSVEMLGENLRQIGLALHNYHSAYKKFPPAIVTDENGNPLYSWRVAILPFIGENDLYNQFDLTKAWNDKANRRFIKKMPKVFRRFGARRKKKITSYAALSSPFVQGSMENTVFNESVVSRLRDMLDGTSNTIMVAESSETRIPWSAPLDVNPKTHPGFDNEDGFSSDLEGVNLVLFGDGSIRLLSTDAPQSLNHSLITRDGREVIDPTELDTYSVVPDRIALYEWDLNNDGEFDAFGPSPRIEEPFFADLPSGTYPILMRVTTTSGVSYTAESSFRINCPNDMIPCGQDKIIICHVNSKKPNKSKESCIKKKKVQKHLKKNPLDYLGYCDCNAPQKSGIPAKSEVLHNVLMDQQSVVVYPNPVLEELQVKLWSEVNEGLELQIFDITGKLLLAKDEQVLRGENQIGIDLGNLRNGLYLLRVTSATRDEVLKVIKAQH